MADNLTEALIDVVRQYPILYNTNDPDYKDLEKKNEKWQEISNNLGYDCVTLKTRWRSLKDCYSKHRRTLRTTTGQAAKKYKKWPWAQQMSFLDTATALRPTSSNIASTTPTTTTPPITSNPPTVSTSTATSAPTLNTTSNIEVTNQTVCDQDIVDNSNIGRRKRQTKPVDPATTVVNYLKNRDQSTKVAKSDIDLLFKSYAQTFKKYSPITQARLKMELAKLFAEADIREIQQQEMVTNSAAYSPIGTNNSTPPVTPQSFIATPSPQPEDLSASGSQQQGFNFDLLSFQTSVSSTNSQPLNILQQQNLDAVELSSVQIQYLDRTVLQANNNDTDERDILNL